MQRETIPPELLRPGVVSPARLRAWRLSEQARSPRPGRWAQGALARRLGVSRRQYVRYEWGDAPIPEHVARKIHEIAKYHHRRHTRAA